MPDRIRLSRTFPNPARGAVRCRVVLPTGGRVRLRILDVRGAVVAETYDGELPAGVHVFTWNGRGSGDGVAGGAYFVRLEAIGEARTQRVVLLR